VRRRWIFLVEAVAKRNEAQLFRALKEATLEAGAFGTLLSGGSDSRSSDYRSTRVVTLWRDLGI
jgi:hypothetical protein